MTDHWKQASKLARAEHRGFTLASFVGAIGAAWLPQPWPVLGWLPLVIVLISAVTSARRHADALGQDDEGGS